MHKLQLVFALLCLATGAWAQSDEVTSANDDTDVMFVPKVKVGEVKVDGEDIPYVEWGKVYIYPQMDLKNKKQVKAYNNLVRNVKKVLPLAKQVNSIIIETYEYTQTLPTAKQREEHLRTVEQDIKKTYTPQMKKLTYAQGKLMIKLVNRECNSTGYELIQAFLGPVRAGFYQAFAWAFGASLKKEYDPEGVDRVTERVVRMVEAGQI